MMARALRVSVGGLLCLAATLAVTSGAAYAAAPVLESVTVCNQEATYRWSLPPSVENRLVQTATGPTTDKYGYFYPQANLYTFNAFSAGNTDTSLVDDEPFSEGTYYVHVGGQDTTLPPPPVVEFSKTVKFVVDASGNGTGVDQPGTSPACPSGSGGGSGGGRGGGGTVNKVTPFGRLSYKRIQSIRKLFVTARSTEAGTLRATGSVAVPGAAKVYRFRPVSRKVGAFASVKLRLKLSKKDLRAVKRALKRKGVRLKAKITVTATNRAGIARSEKATIRLKA